MTTDIMGSLKQFKVFCVGPYKTGTTSVHRFFQSYNLRTYHGPRWVFWCKPRRAHRLDDFDCFSDGMKHPIAFLFDRYPNAKFIYTKRDIRDWMISRHMHRRGRSKRLYYYFLILIGIKQWSGVQFRDEEVKKWPQEYHDHEKRVFDFFEGKRNCLLLIDLSNDLPEDIARRIHEFLNLPGEPHEFPKKNVAPNSLRAFSEQAVDRVLREVSLQDPEGGCPTSC